MGISNTWASRADRLKPFSFHGRNGFLSMHHVVEGRPECRCLGEEDFSGRSG